MAVDLDPRLHPFRNDIAAVALKGQVEAKQFVEPVSMQVKEPVLDLLADPDATGLASQLLFGEIFEVYERSNGFAWGQNRSDGYVGYVRQSGLGQPVVATHIVTALSAHLYERANFKSLPLLSLPARSAVQVTGTDADFLKTADGYLSAKHLSGEPSDFVTEAVRYLGVPYLWGGRSSFGLDCSALVQLALTAIDQDCPRDSDMQMADLGQEVKSAYVRGDLLFWKGHVGIVFDEATLLHANVHHMAVAFENIEEAIERIAKTDGPVICHKRL